MNPLNHEGELLPQLYTWAQSTRAGALSGLPFVKG